MSTTPKVTHCKSCGAPVEWGISEYSKARICVDLRITEIPEGTNLKGCFYRINRKPDGTTLTTISVEEAERIIADAKAGTGFYTTYGISHFKTCPNASQHTRKPNK